MMHPQRNGAFCIERGMSAMAKVVTNAMMPASILFSSHRKHHERMAGK